MKNIKNKKYIKQVCSIIVVAVFSFLAIASTEEEDLSEKIPDIRISASQLHRDYQANEVRADTMYKGKILEITGVVESIGKDFLDTIYVELSVGDEYSFTSIQCFFADSHTEAAANLNEGKRVTIKGRCEGLTMGVVIRGCSIVE